MEKCAIRALFNIVSKGGLGLRDLVFKRKQRRKDVAPKKNVNLQGEGYKASELKLFRCWFNHRCEACFSMIARIHLFRRGDCNSGVIRSYFS